MQACDVFDLVELEAEFVAANREALAANPVMEQSVLDRLKNGNSLEEIQRLVEEEGAEGLYHLGQLVGCVKRAHDIDANLSAHVMHENLVSKASSVLALLNVIHVTGIDRNQVEYVIDCAEEACGDINQRGGGNFAKSAAGDRRAEQRLRLRLPCLLRCPRPRHDRGGGSGGQRRLPHRGGHRRRLHRQAGHEWQGPREEGPALLWRI